MLFWIFATICAFSAIAYFWNESRHWEKQSYPLEVISFILMWVCGIATVACLFVMAISYIDIDAKIEKRNAVYDSLVYQYENDVFDNDDDEIGKKELYNQIEDWNAKVSYWQNIQDDLWLGIFYPNVFDQFKLIEYKEVE